MATDATDDFWQRVRASGLVKTGVLESVGVAASSGQSPETLAARLVTLGVLTAYQSSLLLSRRESECFVGGKYKIIDLLGKGGMGAVYLCEHTALRTLFAVKVLPATHDTSADTRERFYREARAFATLRHPNLVRGFDVDRDGDRHFIVMEYVDGTDLQALSAKVGPLAVPRAVNYVRQAAAGLAHAHSQGWVHRDVKPANVAVDRAGLVRVLDMGLARLILEGVDSITENFDDGFIRGTADYLAPEQASGGTVDGRADVYSLGLTLYFLLTAQLPFSGRNTAQKLVAHLTETPPDVRTSRADVPARLARVVERMTARHPAARYATADEVAEALAEWDVGGPFPPADVDIPVRAVSVSAPTPIQSGYAGQPSLAAPSPFAHTEYIGPRPQPAPTRWMRRVAVVGGAILASAIGIVLLVRAWEEQPRGDPPEVVKTSPSPFHGSYVAVTRTHGPNQVPFPGGHSEYHTGPIFRTVADAVADLRRTPRTGCRVLLLDEFHEESCNLQDVPDGLVIESARAEPTHWIPPQKSPAATPILHVAGGKRVVIRKLTFDGIRIVRQPLVWVGPGPGCRVEDVTVTHFGQCGIALESAAGTAADPVTLSRVRVFGDSVAAVDTCVALAGRPERPTAHVRLADCRLEGPAGEGVLATGDSDGLTVSGCRLFRLQHGLRFDAAARVKATVESTTAAKVTTLVRLDDPNGLSADSGIDVRNTLLFDAAVAVRTDAPRPGGLPLVWVGNWANARTTLPPGEAYPLAFADGLSLGLDTADDAAFLRYPASHPLATAANGGPVGVPRPAR